MSAAGAPYALARSHIPASDASSYPVRSGNLVVPLVDGQAAFSRICEAVETAKKSVWLTVAFIDPDFEMPGGRGSLFDVLDRARARGIDVRALFWRADREHADVFNGHADHHALLGARGSRFLLRWDRAQKHYCQHQKSWLIDAGEPDEIAFIGGINMTVSSVSAVGHAGRDGAHVHDVYCELRGPSATDVHHNFVQRWNEASEREVLGGLWPAPEHHDDLTFPAAISAPAGNSVVQIQRTVRAGHYSDGRASPGSAAFEVSEGEHSVFDQYVKAIDAAQRTIYIEDQYIASPDIVERLHEALERGVHVVFLAPAEPEEQIRAARRRPEAKAFFDRLGALGRHDNFLLAGIAAPQSDGTHRSVYVHAKIMLVDDCWATIGSCNIASQSFFCDTELNAAIWDEKLVRALRRELLAEHLGVDTDALDDCAALALYRSVARENAAHFASGRPLRGLAIALDPAAYAL